jgi:hypothetical protein
VLSRGLDLIECEVHVKIRKNGTCFTLIVRVRIAAITSSKPPRMRLSSREGSYSQMASAFSTTAIFVICSITSMFPRLTRSPRQLREDQRDNIKDKELNKRRVIVVFCCSIWEDHSDCGYLQLFNTSCYYSWCCPRLPCRADMRIFD